MATKGKLGKIGGTSGTSGSTGSGKYPNPTSTSSTNAAEYTLENRSFLRASAVSWNPPPHKATRAPDMFRAAAPELPTATSDVRRNLNGVTSGRLGAIYTALYEGNTDRFSTRYGVRFHYNPVSVAYSYAVDMNRDPTDKFVTLSGYGLVTVGFELYFNRIYDLARPSVSNYEPAQDSRTVSEITSRGTEYDLEFLFRAMNGDPVAVSHVNRKTADFGALNPTLLTVQLGRNGLLFDGILNSLSVNHILFTTDMVPTFTQVSMTFTRTVTELGPAYGVSGKYSDQLGIVAQALSERAQTNIGNETTEE